MSTNSVRTLCRARTFPCLLFKSGEMIRAGRESMYCSLTSEINLWYCRSYQTRFTAHERIVKLAGFKAGGCRQYVSYFGVLKANSS